MAFELKNTVPWGRTIEEYQKMFSLSEADMDNRILSFGDGPASFNHEMTKRKHNVVSVDPIYGFSKEEIQERINETKDIVMEQIRSNLDNFVWRNIKNEEALEKMRMSAMEQFLHDFETGKNEGRYIPHELPHQTNFGDLSFDLGLSSHFLVLYDQLGLEFHIQSMTEMLRVCKEIRIFPLLNLNAQKPAFLQDLLKHFENTCQLAIEKVDYEFQKNGNEMLRMKRRL